MVGGRVKAGLSRGLLMIVRGETALFIAGYGWLSKWVMWLCPYGHPKCRVYPLSLGIGGDGLGDSNIDTVRWCLTV